MVFDTIVFDCDSTLSRIEGVDELARLNGCLDKTEELTTQAMEGEIEFEDVFSKRLDIIDPKPEQLETVGRMYIDSAVKDVKDVITAFKAVGKRVVIISGGYTVPVRMFGEYLGLGSDDVFAVDLRFDEAGKYQGFDPEFPLVRNHGKPELIKTIPGKKLFVGDGITDLEAKDEVGLFVGYGGVNVRQAVKDRASMFIECESLAPLLPIALTQDEQQTLKESHGALLDKGLALCETDVKGWKPSES
ncbi:MAG: HAD-IB family phosphatase [archaeon]